MQLSIITPTFNADKYIEQCIKSVANQKYKHFEHIIMDNNSSDKTREIVLRLQKKYRHLRFVSRKDKGIYDAMNKGINLSKGDWIYFLGADDLLASPSILSKIFTTSNIERFDYLYGDVLWGETGRRYDGRFTEVKLCQKNICHQAIFIRKSILVKLGKFDTSYKILADWIVNYRVFADDNIRKKYIPLLIAKYSLNGLSSIRDDLKYLKERNLIYDRYLSPALNEELRKTKELERQLEAMRTSFAFRLGNYILHPWKIFNVIYFFGFKRYFNKS